MLSPHKHQYRIRNSTSTHHSVRRRRRISSAKVSNPQYSRIISSTVFTRLSKGSKTDSTPVLLQIPDNSRASEGTGSEDSTSEERKSWGRAIPSGQRQDLIRSLSPHRGKDKVLLGSMGKNLRGKRIHRKGSRPLLEGRKRKGKANDEEEERDKTRRGGRKSFRESAKGRAFTKDSSPHSEESCEMLEPYVCGEKATFSEIQKSIGLQSIEQLSPKEVFQDGRHRFDYRFSNARRLGNIDRSYKRLQPLVSKPSVQTVSCVPVQRKKLYLSSDAVWAVSQPILLHEDDEVSDYLYQVPLGGKNSDIHGRHPDHASAERVLTSSDEGNSRVPTAAGSNSELRKVRDSPETEDKLLRLDLGSPKGRGDNDEGEERRNVTCLPILGKGLLERKNSQGEGTSELYRFPEFPETPIHSCQPLSERPLQNTQYLVGKIESELGRKPENDKEEQTRNLMVEKECDGKSTNTVVQEDAVGGDPNYRRVEEWLGSSTSNQRAAADDVGSIPSEDKRRILELSRNNSDTLGDKVFLSSFEKGEGRVSQNTIGQPDSSLYPESDSSEEQVIISCKENLHPLNQNEYAGNSTVLARSRKHKSRLTQQTGTRRRLPAREIHVPERFTEFTDLPNNRYVRNRGEPSSTDLCDIRTDEGSSSSRCFQCELEGPATLPTPTDTTDTEMLEESNRRRSKSSDGNTSVARPTLVASTSTISGKDNSSRRKYGDIIAGLTDEEKELETPSREDNYVDNFLQSISGENYKEAMRFILQIAKQSELDMRVIVDYIKNFGAPALRRKLRGWLAFYKYCQEKEISIQYVIGQDSVKIV
jgi:hypothetical protein